MAVTQRSQNCYILKNEPIQSDFCVKDSAPALHLVNQTEPPAPVVDLGKHELYINRELSQLAFNLRVLDQAMDEAHPLLERMKFLLIFSSNMDEFFEIRVAGLKKQIEFQRENPGPDGMRPREVLEEISRQVHVAVQQQYEIFNNILR